MDYQTYLDQFFENTHGQLEYKFVFPETSMHNIAQNEQNSLYFMNNMQAMQDLFNYEYMKFLYLPYTSPNDENQVNNTKLVSIENNSDHTSSRDDKDSRKTLSKDIWFKKEENSQIYEGHLLNNRETSHDVRNTDNLRSLENDVYKSISDDPNQNPKQSFEDIKESKYSLTLINESDKYLKTSSDFQNKVNEFSIQENDDIDVNKRKDVVFKTVLRKIRRFFRNDFMFYSKNLKRKRRNHIISLRRKIRNYLSKYINTTLSTSIINTFGVFIWGDKIEKAIYQTEDQSQKEELEIMIKIVRWSLYKFNFKRLNEMLELPWIWEIIELANQLQVQDSFDRYEKLAFEIILTECSAK